MNKMKISIGSISALLLFCLWSTNIAADQHGGKDSKREMLAEMWIMVPKEGKMQELEQAMREHVKFRRTKNDPREWYFYTPVFGHKLDRIGVRAGGFTWKDMDSYREWADNQGITEHWQKTADQYVDHYHHYLSVEDHENSNWGPDVDFNYVGVTTYTPKAGHRYAIKEDMKKMADAAKSEKWPYNWGFSHSVAGSGELTLAVPYKDWSAMAPPEQEFAELLSEHMGNEEDAMELLKSWSSHFEEVSYNVWALRRDLME